MQKINGGTLECMSLASSSFDYAPFNKMKADAKKIIMKDIVFIKKSIEVLDANDENFQWHKRCFQDHVQVHLQMIQDYHFPEMKPTGKSLNQNFIAPNQKVILSYMNGLRTVQSLLKSSANSDELKALEMLREWKTQALDEYDQYLVLQPVEEIKSSGRRRTVFFKGDEGAISKSSDLSPTEKKPTTWKKDNLSVQLPTLEEVSASVFSRDENCENINSNTNISRSSSINKSTPTPTTSKLFAMQRMFGMLRAPSPQLDLQTSSESGRKKLKMFTSSLSPKQSKSVRQSLDSPGKFLSLLPSMK